jgi:hypothetical protein
MGRQFSISLIGYHNNGARLCDHEVCPCHAGMGTKYLRACILTHDVRQISRVLILRVGSIGFCKEVGYILGRLVNGRPDDVTRWLIIELLDAFSKVSLSNADIARLKKWPQFTLLGKHRL